MPPLNEKFVLAAFAGYGIELEYMIVSRETLSVMPIADVLLQRAAGSRVSELGRGTLDWSNELVMHLIELKNHRPTPDIDTLPAAFQSEINQINTLLEPMGARLMPTAMHPWMDPVAETRLWSLDQAEIYRAYDRIFDCKRHGWANLQSMHLHFPFADDHEFERLHAAIRLVLPIIPAIAASSPVIDGRFSGYMDYRMQVYRENSSKVPSLVGHAIPETVKSRAEYESAILEPIYRDIAPLDTEGVLHHDWLNSRGAIPRFERGAIEIRMFDLQECPFADFSIAALVIALVRFIYHGHGAALAAQQAIGVKALEAVMLGCIRDAERARIDDSEYLDLLGFPGKRCMANELWRHLAEALPSSPAREAQWKMPLRLILERGPLARRIMDAIGQDWSRRRLYEIYRMLCDCLESGNPFGAASV